MAEPSGSARRVLYVHHCADRGGASESLLALIDSLDRTRFAPEVLLNTVPGPVDAPFLARGIPVHHDALLGTYPHGQGALLALRSLRPWEPLTRALAIPSGAQRFERFLREHPFDLVHLNSMVQVPAAIGARRARVRLIWHVREELHPGILGLRRAAIRRLLDRVPDAVIANSERNASLLIPSARLRVVRNFFRFDRFDRALDQGAARQRAGLPPDRPIVLMLGGAVPHKGLDVLVRAAREVVAARPGVLFAIAGLPPRLTQSPSAMKRAGRRLLESIGWVRNPERDLLDDSAGLRAGDALRFIGMREDVPDLLAAADLLVWPATVSHFSRPVIEAGAMARAVVASDFPASRELVEDGVTGLLVPPRRPAALAASIVRLLDDPARRAAMGEAGHRVASERYDAARNGAAIVAIYDEVLAGRGR